MRDPRGVGDPLDRTVTSAGAGRDEAPPLRFRLRLTHPVQGALPLEAGKGWQVIGRGEAIPHGTVSRRHIGIRKAGLVLEARDEGSHNGTWLMGEPLDAPRFAGDGAVLRLGDVCAVIERVEEDDDAVDRAAIPGDAPSVVALRRLLGRMAPGAAHLLLLGATGTGKERIAAEAHRLSGRGAFVAFNCAGLTPQLADSQLFGHARGAFTGADAAHDGLFRRADGGTLFLDEVAELAPEVQAKLLRVLETGEVTPLGGAPTRVDVRVVAATHPALEARVRDGRFRRDLHARLSIGTLTVPALRERRGDVPGWLGRFDARWREREGGAPLAWAPEAMERAMLADWPDNLRGLDRAVYQLRTHLGPGATVTPDALGALAPARPGEAPGEASAPEGRPGKPSAEELRRVLEETGGSVRATAKHFQRDRKQIYRWMKAYGIG